MSERVKGRARQKGEEENVLGLLHPLPVFAAR